MSKARLEARALRDYNNGIASRRHRFWFARTMAKEKRSVLVSGGSRGLGLAIAQRLAACDYRVIAIARNKSKGVATAIAHAEQTGQGPFHFEPFDLGKIDEIPILVRKLHAQFGPLFGLVNNAALGHAGVLATMRDTAIEEQVRVNTLSPILLTKYVVRGMMSAGAGRIVNVASIIGVTGYSGLVAYAATKASMIGLTRSLAREVGRLNINVNAVAPGFLTTDMTRTLDAKNMTTIVRRSALRRLAEVDDVASAVEFLLSDKARNITGTVLTVDAGTTA
jgi:3-oxoacyl-[acyl-carrier protein] reductase